MLTFLLEMLRAVIRDAPWRKAILFSRDTYLVVESEQLRSGPALSADDVCPRRVVAEGGNRPEVGRHDVRRAVRRGLPGGLFLLVGGEWGSQKRRIVPPHRLAPASRRGGGRRTTQWSAPTNGFSPRKTSRRIAAMRPSSRQMRIPPLMGARRPCSRRPSSACSRPYRAI